MPNKKFYITLEPNEQEFLSILAKEKDKPISLLIKEFIEEALENHEDMALAAIANKRLKKPQKTVLHEDVWQKLLKQTAQK
ncbi:hypothetical protein K2W90_02545 [Candidatus Babeliales bacterium]|nr:hypothetical protein [Candidatus Babeliales bacterium]